MSRIHNRERKKKTFRTGPAVTTMESEEESAGEKGRRAANWRCPESLGLASGPGCAYVPASHYPRLEDFQGASGVN